jgi:signal transduction histidine kinase
MGFDLLLADAARSISDDQRGHVETMVDLCDDLLDLTRRYLDYAGLVHGARPPAIATYTVGALIREIDLRHRALAAERGISWSCRLEGPNSTVATDASRCQQAFDCVVDNALKFTPEGGEVSVIGRLAGRSWVVSCEDTGPGVPVDQLGRVFDPFYKLARSQPAQTRGNGLGLTICRALVEQLGGEVQLQSSEGRGVRATVRLPLDPSETHAGA